MGEAIRAERQLAGDLGVPRRTVRAAIDGLVRDGQLARRHGSGTYVTEPKIAQPRTLTSFTEDMPRRGMVPESRTLEVTAGSPGPRPAPPLQGAPGGHVVRVPRP